MKKKKKTKENQKRKENDVKAIDRDSDWDLKKFGWTLIPHSLEAIRRLGSNT